MKTLSKILLCIAVLFSVVQEGHATSGTAHFGLTLSEFKSYFNSYMSIYEKTLVMHSNFKKVDTNFYDYVFPDGPTITVRTNSKGMVVQFAIMMGGNGFELPYEFTTSIDTVIGIVQPNQNINEVLTTLSKNVKVDKRVRAAKTNMRGISYFMLGAPASDGFGDFYIFTIEAKNVTDHALPKLPVRLVLDGVDVTMEATAKPFVDLNNGKTYVPLRFLFESIPGLSVNYNSTTKTVSTENIAYTNEQGTIIPKHPKVTFKLNERYIYVDGIKKDLGVSPQIFQGSTYIPLRSFSDIFEVGISWDAKSKTVTVSTNKVRERVEEQLGYRGS